MVHDTFNSNEYSYRYSKLCSINISRNDKTLCTSNYRSNKSYFSNYDNYSSIFKNDDITWHISKTSRNPDPDYEFIKSDKMIKLYNVDCDDTDTTAKRNAVLEKIKDGYFCFLDDDTVFHENMYIKYLRRMMSVVQH